MIPYNNWLLPHIRKEWVDIDYFQILFQLDNLDNNKILFSVHLFGSKMFDVNSTEEIWNYFKSHATPYPSENIINEMKQAIIRLRLSDTTDFAFLVFTKDWSKWEIVYGQET